MFGCVGCEEVDLNDVVFALHLVELECCQVLVLLLYNHRNCKAVGSIPNRGPSVAFFATVPG